MRERGVFTWYVSVEVFQLLQSVTWWCVTHLYQLIFNGGDTHHENQQINWKRNWPKKNHLNENSLCSGKYSASMRSCIVCSPYNNANATHRLIFFYYCFVFHVNLLWNAKEEGKKPTGAFCVVLFRTKKVRLETRTRKRSDGTRELNRCCMAFRYKVILG